MIKFYDYNPVPLTYSQSELAQLVDEYLNGVSFVCTYKEICRFILDKAITEGRVENANSTEYSSREISPLSSIEISKYLWSLIWDKKIFIAFGGNPFIAQHTDDVRFIINK